MLALVGESGCGKTTTAQSILRLVEAESGRSASRARTSRSSSGRKLRAAPAACQLIFQDPYESLDPRFRVRETVEEPLLDPRGGRQRRASARSACATR